MPYVSKCAHFSVQVYYHRTLRFEQSCEPTYFCKAETFSSQQTTELTRRRQKTKCEGYNGRTILTLARLLAVKRGDQQKLVVPWSLRQYIMKENHDVPSVGHVGMHKTLELVDRHFHWRGHRGDVLQYVKTCPTYQLVKSDSRAKAGLLRPLEISSRKWVHVTTDLVIDLPDSDGYMAIAVFVNKLTKWYISPAVQRRLQPWNM